MEELWPPGPASHGDNTYGPVLQKKLPDPINPFLWPAEHTYLASGKYGHQKPNENPPTHHCGCHPRIHTPTKKLRASDALCHIRRHSLSYIHVGCMLILRVSGQPHQNLSQTHAHPPSLPTVLLVQAASLSLGQLPRPHETSPAKKRKKKKKEASPASPAWPSAPLLACFPKCTLITSPTPTENLLAASHHTQSEM